MNHQLKEEEYQKTKIKSPGVSIIEHDITIVPASPDYKIKKIKKILNRITSS